MWGGQQWLPNQFDPQPSWQLNSKIRPNRLVWSTIYQLPFGKGRQWLTQGPLNHILGGWQMSWIYTYETGALISWGNQFYYGTVDQVAAALNQSQTHSQNINMWYSPAAVWTGNTAPPSGFVGFEGRSANQPNTYNARIFPQYVDSLRNDPVRNWDAKVLRSFRLYERLSLETALDLLNVTNHTQFGSPNITVTAVQFGQLSSQSNSGRIISVQHPPQVLTVESGGGSQLAGRRGMGVRPVVGRQSKVRMSGFVARILGPETKVNWV
jgi:hypothetical protein